MIINKIKIPVKVRRTVTNMYYRLMPYKYGINTTEKRERKIIVSLTSYPKRFETLPLTIKSLLRQSKKPDKILLVLHKGESEKFITEELKKMANYGVEIVFIEKQLKAHKKYFYAMEKYPDDIIITVDDDILYPKHLIEKLFKSYGSYPKCVNAARVHRIKLDAEGNILPYNDWEYECKGVIMPSHSLLATGGAGCLYPPRNEWKMNSEVLNSNAIIKLSLNADDIWLKGMEVLSNIPVVFVPNANPFVCANGEAGKEGLYQTNVWENANDVCISNVMSQYKISAKRFIVDGE